MTWPARSPASWPLSSFGYFDWGIMKQEISSAPKRSAEELRNKIGTLAQIVQDKLLPLKMAVRAIRKLARASIRKEDRQFENEQTVISMVYSLFSKL